MRQKTRYDTQPSPHEVVRIENGFAIVKLRENIEAVQSEEGAQYQADEYTVTVPYNATLADRVAEGFADWLSRAKQVDYDEIALKVRNIRNSLLKDSDAEVALDRLGLDIPSTITATTILATVRAVFTALREAVSGDMAVYRQALRDLPNQPGFPYDVTFPVKPQD